MRHTGLSFFAVTSLCILTEPGSKSLLYEKAYSSVTANERIPISELCLSS